MGKQIEIIMNNNIEVREFKDGASAFAQQKKGLYQYMGVGLGEAGFKMVVNGVVDSDASALGPEVFVQTAGVYATGDFAGRWVRTTEAEVEQRGQMLRRIGVNNG